MFKQVFRLTFITFVWKKYKRAIVSTLLLFFYLWLVGVIHGDYLRAYPESDIGYSFMLKWAALIGGTLIYLLINFWGRKKPSTKVKAETKELDENDPFAEIRARKTLRSKAEMIIEKEKEK